MGAFEPFRFRQSVDTTLDGFFEFVGTINRVMHGHGEHQLDLALPLLDLSSCTSARCSLLVSPVGSACSFSHQQIHGPALRTTIGQATMIQL